MISVNVGASQARSNFTAFQRSLVPYLRLPPHVFSFLWFSIDPSSLGSCCLASTWCFFQFFSCDLFLVSYSCGQKGHGTLLCNLKTVFQEEGGVCLYPSLEGLGGLCAMPGQTQERIP